MFQPLPSSCIELDDLVAPFSVMSEAEAIEVAQSFFGVRGRATRFAAEKDGMSYLNGTPLDATRSSAEQREQIVKMLAGLRLALADLSHPSALHIVPWDAKNMPGVLHLLDDIADPRRAERLSLAVERLAPLQCPMVGLRRQAVHNEFSKSDLFVQHGKTEFVSAGDSPPIPPTCCATPNKAGRSSNGS